MGLFACCMTVCVIKPNFGSARIQAHEAQSCITLGWLGLHPGAHRWDITKRLLINVFQLSCTAKTSKLNCAVFV